MQQDRSTVVVAISVKTFATMAWFDECRIERGLEASRDDACVPDLTIDTITIILSCHDYCLGFSVLAPTNNKLQTVTNI